MNKVNQDTHQRPKEPIKHEVPLSRSKHLTKQFRQWLGGEISALRRRRHGNSLRTDGVDPLAAEVHKRLHRYAREVDVEDPGYLLGISENVSNEWGTSLSDRAQQAMNAEANEQDTPAKDDMGELGNRLVQRVVDELPARKRFVLVMHVNEGLTYEQIAKRLELPGRLVLTDLTLAYSYIHRRLSGQETEILADDDETAPAPV